MRRLLCYFLAAVLAFEPVSASAYSPAIERLGALASAAKSAHREISAALESASALRALVSQSRVWEKSAPSENSASGPAIYLYTGEQYDSDLGLQYLRARYMNARSGTFVSRDEFQGIPVRPSSLNACVYAETNSIDRSDPSGHETLPSTTAAANVNTTASAAQITARGAVQKAFRNAGCELAVDLAGQVVEQGVYILYDIITGQVYVGESSRMPERLKEHLREGEKTLKSAWKKTARLLASFPVKGGKEAFHRAEQLIIELLKEDGNRILNRREQIKSGDKRKQYDAFRKLFCQKK